MRDSRRILSAVLVSVSLLFFAGCQEAPRPQQQTMNIAANYNPESLDPHARDLVGQFAVAANFYEPLVRLDARMRLVPCLAESWENPDPLTWIFHLRHNVKFHSGKPFNSHDVVYSFERLLDHEDLEMRAYLSGVSEVTAPDDFTLQLRTNLPLALLPNKLNFVLIVPQGSTADTLTRQPDGTSPYTFAGWERGKLVHMKRFEQYWGAKPSIPVVNFHLNLSPDEAVQGLPSGRYQLIQFDSKKLEKVVGSLERYRMIRNDTLFVTHLGYDLSRQISPHCSAVPNPFLNPLVRRALHLAVDRNALVEAIPFYGSPATQPIPPFVFGFNSAIAATVPDPQKAKSLMAEAGYGSGFSVTLHSTRTLTPTAQIVADQLKQIGIQTTIAALPAPEYYKTLDAGESSFFISSFGCVSGDASDYLMDALHSRDTARSLGGSNFGRYTNAEFDRLIDESAAIQKLSDRSRRMQQLQQLAMQELPWIPLYVDQEVYALDQHYKWEPRSDSFILAQEISLRR